MRKFTETFSLGKHEEDKTPDNGLSYLPWVPLYNKMSAPRFGASREMNYSLAFSQVVANRHNSTWGWIAMCDLTGISRYSFILERINEQNLGSISQTISRNSTDILKCITWYPKPQILDRICHYKLVYIWMNDIWTTLSRVLLQFVFRYDDWLWLLRLPGSRQILIEWLVSGEAERHNHLATCGFLKAANPRIISNNVFSALDIERIWQKRNISDLPRRLQPSLAYKKATQRTTHNARQLNRCLIFSFIL